MKTIHAHWAWVAVVATGASGLWGLTLAVMKRPPGRAFRIGVGVAVTAMLVQVGLGFLVYGQGLRPDSEFHLFYGFLVLFTLAFAYILRAKIGLRPALTWGLVLLFTMGLGVRAWVVVAG